MTTTFTDNKNGITYTTSFALGEIVDANIGDKKIRGKIIQFSFGRRGTMVMFTTVNGEGNVQSISADLDDITPIVEG